MHRPPLNLLRQEIAGTSIYLDILQKTTVIDKTDNEKPVDASSDIDTSNDEVANADKKLKGIAEEKLVSFCEQILKEASEIQPNTGESASVDIHRVLELRSPVIVKVNIVFGPLLQEFQPLPQGLRLYT